MPAQDRHAREWRELALLWATRRCGALEALSTTAGTAESVADQADLDAGDAERLVAALETRGFLDRVDGELEPTNRLLGFLTKTDLRSVGSLPAELDAFQRWVSLPEALAGAPAPEPPETVRNQLGSEATVDDRRLRSEVTTAVRAAGGGDSVIVVGDGAAGRASEFAARGWDVTLLDGPDRIDAIEPLCRSEPFELRAGEPTAVPACDLAVFVGTLRRHGAAAGREIVEAAEAASVAVFFDVFGGATDGASLVDVERLAAGSGRVHDAASVRSWLRSSFDAASVRSVPASPLSAAVGRAID